jgi:hypothetical protein
VDYLIHTEVKFGPRELVDVGRIADERPEPWWNQTLSSVNDCVAYLGVLEGDVSSRHHAVRGT